MKSNFYINEKGFYADTLFLKNFFEKITYQIAKNPTDSTKIVGLIELRFLSKQDRKRVIGIFSHSNFKYDCYYNIKKNETAVYVTRIENDEIHDLLEKLFKDTYSNVYYNRIYTDYNKNEKFSANSQFGTLTRYYPKKLIVEWYDENKIGGEFNHVNGNLIYKDLILANPSLERHVTPYYIFANCDYGIQKIITFFDTTELVSVNLE